MVRKCLLAVLLVSLFAISINTSLHYKNSMIKEHSKIHSTWFGESINSVQ